MARVEFVALVACVVVGLAAAELSTCDVAGTCERTLTDAKVNASQPFDEIADLKSFYEANGFLHIPKFYSDTEMEELLELVELVQNTNEEVGGQMMYFEQGLTGQGRILRRVEDFAHRHQGLTDMFLEQSGKLPRFTADLIGEDVLLFKEKINFKLPGASGFKAHQDHQAGWGKYVDWFVSVGVCLDCATTENGCLEVAAGYHKDGLLGEEWKPIEDLDIPYDPLECEPGDILVFDSYVPHRSAENLTDKQRRMIFLTYNLQSEGEHRSEYFADKRVEYPPDVERKANESYVYRV